MSELQRTVFFDRHLSQGAEMVDFGGWEMPLMYPSGIVEEHLTTRKGAGLFDISHMGRFTLRGPGDNIGRAHPRRPHQLSRRFEAVRMVLHVHPDSVEPHQAGKFKDRRVGEVERGDQRRFVAEEFLFYAALSHGCLSVSAVSGSARYRADPQIGKNRQSANILDNPAGYIYPSENDVRVHARSE